MTSHVIHRPTSTVCHPQTLWHCNSYPGVWVLCFWLLWCLAGGLRLCHNVNLRRSFWRFFTGRPLPLPGFTVPPSLKMFPLHNVCLVRSGNRCGGSSTIVRGGGEGGGGQLAGARSSFCCDLVCWRWKKMPVSSKHTHTHHLHWCRYSLTTYTHIQILWMHTLNYTPLPLLIWVETMALRHWILVGYPDFTLWQASYPTYLVH